MKKFIALLLAIVAGFYLAVGWVPDPIPFIDEGAALLVLLNCLAYLGLDIRRFFGMKSAKEQGESRTIDVE